MTALVQVIEESAKFKRGDKVLVIDDIGFHWIHAVIVRCVGFSVDEGFIYDTDYRTYVRERSICKEMEAAK